MNLFLHSSQNGKRKSLDKLLVNKKKKLSKPMISNSLKDLNCTVTNYPPINNILRIQVDAEDNSTACIFSTQEMFTKLGTASEIYLHTTFKV